MIRGGFFAVGTGVEDSGGLVGRVDDLDAEPVDAARIGTVAQRHIGQPAIPIEVSKAPAFDPLAKFRQRGMRARLADEQEMPIRRLSRK